MTQPYPFTYTVDTQHANASAAKRLRSNALGVRQADFAGLIFDRGPLPDQIRDIDGCFAACGIPSVVRLPPNASALSASLKTSPPIPSTTMLRLSAPGLRRDPHGSVKQIHHEELEDGEKERPSAFPKIMLKQTDSGIQ